MDTNRKIVKALLMKDYAALKEGVFSTLYTKASLALNEARHGVAEAVFNAAKQLDEAGVAKYKRIAVAHAKAKYGSKAGNTNPEKAKRLEPVLAAMKAKVQAKARKKGLPPAAFGMREEAEHGDVDSKREQARAAAKKKDKALKKWFETRKSKKTP